MPEIIKLQDGLDFLNLRYEQILASLTDLSKEINSLKERLAKLEGKSEDMEEKIIMKIENKILLTFLKNLQIRDDGK
jgi:predicted  nucleic acid-binding Zn-ribbon protein